MSTPAVPPPPPAANPHIPLREIAAAIPFRRNLIVALCLVIASLAEGIGIATLLPLVAVLGDGDDSSKSNLISSTVLGGFDLLHLPRDPALLLAVIGLGMLAKSGLMLYALGRVGDAVADVSTTLRLRLIEALMAARWGYYVQQPVGRFAAALGADATRAGDAYNSLTLMFSLSVQALMYLTIAALASWKLALLSIMVSLVMIGSLQRLLHMARKSARTQQRRLHALLVRLTDALVGIKPMKAMARHARFDALFQHDLAKIRKAARKQVFARNANKALQEPILALCLAIGIFGAIKLLRLPVGEVLIMSLLLAKFVSIVGKAQQELQNVRAAEAGFVLARDAVNETVQAREAAHGGAEPQFTRELRFRDVTFGYPGRRIVDGGSFTIRAGEVVALTGPSGTGKTTLVDLLLGLHEPEAGEILIDDQPLTGIDLIRWRSLTGYVPQELMLFNDSILLNVTLGEPQFSREDVERALREAGAWEFVGKLQEGIDTVVGERGGALSGGQRQRIAIARALVHRPRLLILDEATSALDPASERLIVDNVLQLARDTGLTVLSISHHAAWVEVADRVVRLEDCRVSERLPRASA